MQAWRDLPTDEKYTCAYTVGLIVLPLFVIGVCIFVYLFAMIYGA
jgi:hypothetical protein